MIGDTGHASIQTFTGRFVKPLGLRPSDVDALDIAHALSNVCRFQGHVRDFYSVAQHSVIVSRVVPAKHALAALMHDSPEAYVCDLAGPLKRDTELGRAYKEIETRIAAAIEARLSLTPGAFSHPDVKRADWEVLQVEGRQLMPNNGWARDDVLEDMWIAPQPPYVAKHKFLARYAELTGDARAV